MRLQANDLESALYKVRRYVLSQGKEVETGTWQDQKSPFKFLEVMNISVIAPMAKGEDSASKQCKATQPWALAHFKERVSGIPSNPPPSHTEWAKTTGEHFSAIDPGKFSHSYPERMWPKGKIPPMGIRYAPGDLQDAANLLAKDPSTRQCYVPMVYPEDITAANMGERVPCSLGWHFMVRNKKLSCFYPMRSCDVVRHMHNDWYFANMLTLWMHSAAGLGDLGIKLGNLHFVATSLHCFTNDRYALGQLCKESAEAMNATKEARNG